MDETGGAVERGTNDHATEVLPPRSKEWVEIVSIIRILWCLTSITAYAAVVYLVEEDEGLAYPFFVVSKTRVSPLKLVTIPRLELLSAELLSAVCLISNVTGDPIWKIEISRTKMLHRLTSRALLDHRHWEGLEALCSKSGWWDSKADTVRRLTQIESWSHCPGKENPADLPSRGLTPTELVLSQVWKYGPDWLKIPESPRITPSIENIPEPCLKSSSKVER